MDNGPDHGVRKPRMSAGGLRAQGHPVLGTWSAEIETVDTQVPRTRQERARAICLSRLIAEPHSYSVTDLIVEARTTQLDARDIKTVRGDRFSLTASTRFHVVHVAGNHEPLL